MKKFAFLFAFIVCSFSVWGQSVGRPSAILDGRTYLGTLPQAVSKNSASGVVVVTIWVDPYGNVTKAEAGAEGTKTNSDDLWNAAREAAMKTRFNQKADAPALQQGSMIYIFSDISRTAAFPGIKTIGNDSAVIKEDIDENALKFLGIPIDGSREYMVAQLKEKGFEGSTRNEYLEGQFNGEPVKVFVHTYHDKVDRIIVDFDHVPEMSLNEQYNHLLSLLVENEKYVPLGTYSPIPPEENCETEIFLNKKDYRVRFSYVSPNGHEESEGEVWLSILNRRGNRVCLYYDNLNNRPKGEDL